MNLRIVYHLLVFDTDQRHVLIDPRGDRWLLPMVTYVGPPGQHAEALPGSLARLGISAWPVHDAIVPDSASVVPQAYCAFVVRELDGACRQTWMSLDVATRMPCLLDIQRTALARCVDRFRHADAELDSPGLAEAPEAWARAALAATGYVPAGEPRVLRHTRDRRVTLWPTTSGNTYVKVSACSVAREARVTDALAEILPAQFARTIQLDPVRGWWLYRGVAGDVLTPNRLTPEIGERLGMAVASVQRHTTSSATIRSALGPNQCLASDLMAVAGMAEALAQRDARDNPDLAALHSGLAWAEVMHACSELGRLPASFLHRDLWLPNIVDRGQSLGFLDTEGSYWGPVVLPLWRLLSRLRGRFLPDIAQRVVEGYTREWRNRGSAAGLETAVRRLGVTGRLFQLKTQLDKAGHRSQDYASLSTQWPPTRTRLDMLKAILLAVRAPIE